MFNEKTIKFTLSTNKTGKSLIKLLKSYQELRKQGVTRVHLVAKNSIGYYSVAWLTVYQDSPRSLIVGIENILDGMLLSRIVSCRECTAFHRAVQELWEYY